MYYLRNGRTYIGINEENRATSVSNLDKALAFSEKKKAENYRDNLKTTLKKFNWMVIEVKDEDTTPTPDTTEETDTEHEETTIEISGIDISVYFKEAIKTLSQLRRYASNMQKLEEEYNKKILDVRHYKRDIRTKLNAIQLQRLEQFEIQLERERYECKSNRRIAEIFLVDLNRLRNINYIEVVKRVKESEYKPEILTYEMLDNIVGKRELKKKG